MGLPELWFLLVGVLLAGYAIFDGFDLGVGTLYPFLGKSEEDKRQMLRSIGPIWDGNEVWLLTGGGALFAAFPSVYATVFSGFYLALMLLLFCLIFRAASLEFRTIDPTWVKFWDGAFFVGSAVPSLLFGVAVGNIIRGLPLAANGDMIAGGGNPVFLGNLVSALNPYSLVIGLVGLVWIMLHGASWLTVKTTGSLYDRALAMRKTLLVVFVALFVVATAATALLVNPAFARAIGSPAGWLFIALCVAGVVVAFTAGAKDRIAFYGTALSGASMVGIWAASIFPNIVPAISADSPLWVAGPVEQVADTALTVSGAASSQLTLTVMLIIAALGVPLVLYYFFLIYKTYAGRVDLSTGNDGHY